MEKNKELEVVRVKMITDKKLYSEYPLTSPEAVCRFVSKELADYDREVMCVLNCSTKGQVLNMNVVSMGTLDACLVTGRELFKSAILSNAASVILVHNHPSGDYHPSREDKVITAKISAGGKLLGIDVVDHIIVAGNSGEYYSMRANGDLNELGEQLLKTGEVIAEPLVKKEHHVFRKSI